MHHALKSIISERGGLYKPVFEAESARTKTVLADESLEG